MEIAATRTTTTYAAVVKWARRLSALSVFSLLLYWALSGQNTFALTYSWLLSRANVLRWIPPDRAVGALFVAWYAFLTQLKIRWSLWLPFYLLIFSPTWILWNLFYFMFNPLLKALLAAGREQTVVAKGDSSAVAWPLKRLWLLLLFVWLVAFRGLDLSWATWIPPMLALPVWWISIRLAYQSAIGPRTFAKFLASLCGSLLDSQAKAFSDAKEQGKPKPSPDFSYRIVQWILERYSDERVLAVVQKESLAVFSGTLVIALIASAVFWGLVGSAIFQSHSTALSSYDFFSSGSLLECILWALGCMTTTVDFPGSGAPIWLKLVHAGILITGIFQLTILLACFSIMTGNEARRIADSASKTLQIARAKLNETKAFEATVIDVGTTKADATIQTAEQV